MIDNLKKSVIEKYKKLCRFYKINNWQKEVFMSNCIELLEKQQKEIEELKKKIK